MSRRKSPWYLFSTAVIASCRVISSAATAAARSRACTSSEVSGPSTRRTPGAPGRRHPPRPAARAPRRRPPGAASPTTRSTRSRPVGSIRSCAVEQRAMDVAERGGALPAVGGGDHDADIERARDLVGDADQVTALEDDLGEPGVQGVDPRQPVDLPSVIKICSPSVGIVGTTSHRRRVRRPDSVGEVIAVSAPRRVRDRLLRTPDGPVPVLHRGPHAVYLEVEGACLGVARRGCGAGPVCDADPAAGAAERRGGPGRGRHPAPRRRTTADRPDHRTPSALARPGRPRWVAHPRRRARGRRRRPDAVRRRRAVRVAGRAPRRRALHPTTSTPRCASCCTARRACPPPCWSARCTVR